MNYSTISGFEIIRAYNSYANGFQDSVNQPHSRCLAPLCRCSKGLIDPLLTPHFDNNDIAFSEDQFVAKKSAGSYVLREPARAPFKDFISYDLEIEPLMVGRKFLLFDESQSRLIHYIFLSLSCLFCLLAVATLALIVLKMYLRSVKGNQSLGIILLIGILMLFISSFAFLTEPSEIVNFK